MKTCILDIDGVLNYYPDCWIDFVNANNKLEIEFTDLYSAKESLSYAEYTKLKERYRISGIKEKLESRAGSSYITKLLKENGYYIIILSSRPVERYNCLVEQTTNWLSYKGIMYDYLAFGEAKHLEIIQKFGSVEFVVEDNRFYANSIARHGYKVLLIDNLYNQGQIEKCVTRIEDLYSLIALLKLKGGKRGARK